MNLELLDFRKYFINNAQHYNLCHTFELQLLWVVINVAKTSLCIGLLISDIFVYFHVVSLQLPLHSLCAWFVYQIIVLLQKKLDVQQGIFLLFLALVFLFGTYFFLQNILSFYFLNRLGNKVCCNFSLHFHSHAQN